MRSIKGWLSLGVMAFLVWACSARGPAPEREVYRHPELSAQEMLIACQDCHRTETPEIYNEWRESRHGIAMVKCFQCHGTFETFHKVTRENCRTCHAKPYENCPKDKLCWECHSPHLFKKHVK